MASYIVDSWAWVEYLRGSKAGNRVKQELERGSEVFTHVLTLAELTSKFKRGKLDFDSSSQAVATLSKIITVSEVDAKTAGILHATVKEKSPNFSLADAFVLHAAKKLNCKILTGDPDFQGIREAIMLT